MGCEMPYRPSMSSGVLPFTGRGIVLDPIGNSLTVGQSSTVPADPGDGWRYYQRATLPNMVSVGAVTDPRGFKHDGVGGRVISDQIAVCAASGALSPTPTHVVLTAFAIPDIYYSVAPAAIRSGFLTCLTNIIDDASAPKCLVGRDSPYYFDTGTDLTTAIQRADARGQRAWQMCGLSDAQVAAGRGARFRVFDPLITAAVMDPDGVHWLNAGHERYATALRNAMRTFGAGTVAGATPRHTSQADLIATMGADLLHAYDGRDPMTEATGISQWAAFVGGTTADQATAGLQPLWTGGAARCDGTDDTLRLSSDAIIGTTYTLTFACQILGPPSGYAGGLRAVFSLAQSAALGMQIYFDDAFMYLREAGAATYASVKAPFATDRLPHVFTITRVAGNAEDAASWTARVDSVDATVATDAGPAAGVLALTSVLSGARSGPSVFLPWPGTIDALLIANSGLTTAKRDAMETFANAVIA